MRSLMSFFPWKAMDVFDYKTLSITVFHVTKGVWEKERVVGTGEEVGASYNLPERSLSPSPFMNSLSEQENPPLFFLFFLFFCFYLVFFPFLFSKHVIKWNKVALER